MRPPPFLLAAMWAGPLAAQTGGAIAGHVRDAAGPALHGAQVVVDARISAATDSSGAFRFREVRSGWHRVRASYIGYRTVIRDSVLVRAGQATIVEFALEAEPLSLEPLLVRVPVDPVLDPLATSSVQRVTADDIRRLPVTTIDEAVALSAGSVGESYRGGRVGQQAFVLDGLGVKNQLDASTGGLGIRLPPDVLTEAALVTNGFSARYGQAISGLINVVTKDGGDRWSGRVAYESDRAFGGTSDLGLDRIVAQADGPLGGGVRILGAVDATGRLDADPVNAPVPADARDPRAARPHLLPHNSGEQVDLSAKLTVPFAGRQTLRLFGLHSVEQRLLFDPAFKYDLAFAPARRVVGDLASGHLQLTSSSRTEHALIADLRVAYFRREFLRGLLAEPADQRFGAFTGERFRFVGEDLALAQDTAASRVAIPGFTRPESSERTPWGVPAFFLGGGSRGEISFTRFRELRAQFDVTLGAGRDVDVYAGSEVVRQRVETFQRVLGYLPVGDGVPPPAASDFSPLVGAAYAETQVRWSDLGITFGARYERFDPRAALAGSRLRARHSVSPRLAVSTVLRRATFVASWGRFSQAPDFQYLVDAAFDDTTRTGRFRRGNPSLGFERASQFEFSVRARPRPGTSLRLNFFYKRLEGLVASVPLGLDADSSIFGNTDFGTVQGAEMVAERELRGGWGARVAYTLQRAEATATNAFQLLSRIHVIPGTTDTIVPTRVEFPLDYDRRHAVTAILEARVGPRAGPALAGAHLLAGLEAAAIVRWGSGLPYSRTNATGDSLVGLPNDHRLPSQSTVDVLVRRPLRVAGLLGGAYVDVRNLLGRRNIVAVRRDSGEPGPGASGIAAMADAAYARHPEPIPYESPRYRGYADLDGNGLIEGRTELLPLYAAAARDFSQPLFAYGPPRLVRLGLEVLF